MGKILIPYYIDITNPDTSAADYLDSKKLVPSVITNHSSTATSTRSRVPAATTTTSTSSTTSERRRLLIDFSVNPDLLMNPDRSSSTTTNASTNTNTNPNLPKILACKNCNTHLSTTNDILSKHFQGSTGQAYLISTVLNSYEPHESTERNMTTGLHVVKDVCCLNCSNVLGWRYVQAYVEDQRYKEGKWVLEKALIIELN